jgi:hypothetical protein
MLARATLSPFFWKIKMVIKIIKWSEKNQDVVNDAFVQEYKISIWNTLHFWLHIKWQGVTTLEFGNVYCSAYSYPHFRKLEWQDLRAPGPYRAPQDAVGDSCTIFLQKRPHSFQNATRSQDRVEYKSTCGPETGDDRGHLDGRHPHGSPQRRASPWFTSTTGLPALAWEHRPLRRRPVSTSHDRRPRATSGLDLCFFQGSPRSLYFLGIFVCSVGSFWRFVKSFFSILCSQICLLFVFWSIDLFLI